MENNVSIKQMNSEQLAIVSIGGITASIGAIAGGVAIYGVNRGWSSTNIHIILIFSFCLVGVGMLLIVLPLSN